MSTSAASELPNRRRVVETTVPARLDRLPWSSWHWVVVVALGITWVLDGLEVTIVGAIGPRLQSVHLLSASQVGLAGTFYLVGAVVGSLVFGYLTDRWGRKNLFMVTLGVYLLFTVLTAFSPNAALFLFFRTMTGLGIGGEYSAINSAIDELIPARVRGWVDLAINGSWWVGTAAGAALTLPLLDPHLLPKDIGWRVAFGLGAVLGLAVLIIRRYLPESPRWLLTHGRAGEAEEVVDGIEQDVAGRSGVDDLPDPEGSIRVAQRGSIGFGEIAKTMFGTYPRRSILGFSLMAAQAFFYNAIFFTYALVLTNIYHVSSASVGLYLLPFAAGNFLGPLLLGRLFDAWGRRVMISATYILSAVTLAITGWLFAAGVLTAVTQTICWVIVFFFASSGASAAYLTVSEVFPLEIRAMAIAFFYSIATAAGGIGGPVLFGILIASGKPGQVNIGYAIGAALMFVAGVLEVVLGVDAEQRSLEDVATPITSEEAGEERGRESEPRAATG